MGIREHSPRAGGAGVGGGEVGGGRRKRGECWTRSGETGRRELTGLTRLRATTWEVDAELNIRNEGVRKKWRPTKKWGAWN